MYLKFITHPSLSTCSSFFYKFAYMIRFIEIQKRNQVCGKKWDKRLADMMEKGKIIQ